MQIPRTVVLNLLGGMLLLAACSSDSTNESIGTGGATGAGGAGIAGAGGGSSTGASNGTGAGGAVVGTGGFTNGAGGSGTGGAGTGSDGTGGGGARGGGGSAGAGTDAGNISGSGGARDASVGARDAANGGGGGPRDSGSAGFGGADAGGASDGGAGPAVPSAGCGKTRALQDGTRTITSSGISRTYLLRTPSNYNNTHPYRVVFMFHWNFGSINSIVNPPDADHNTDRPFYGMSDLSGDSTIFVVPMGLNDTGGAGWANPNNRDVIFTDDMLVAVSGDLCIDTSRVFTTGFSYGASMSYKLACARPDKFRAAVVYNVGSLSGNSPAECTAPIAFFHSHGVDDPILNYTQSGLAILNVFTRLNGCTAMTPANPPQNGHACISYAGCSRPTRFCNFGSGEDNPFNPSLGGHYPSAKDPGQTTSWIPAEAWNFIAQF